MSADEAAEGARQRALLAAILAPAPDAAAPPGLLAYRANAHASAERALAVACPTLRALLGEADFAQLARELWHADPPRRGDLAQWGAALPDWIAVHRGLAQWPYLADCARLDLALQRCERAADAEPDLASLARLSSIAPDRLQLRLMPGLTVIASRWPLASIHAAHAGNGDPALFGLARERIEQGQGEAVLVARAGWRATVRQIDAATAAFMEALLGAADLARALDEAGPDFDFAAWLADALRSRWLKEVCPVAD